MTTCPTGHKLKLFNTARVGYSCDVCSGRARPFDTFFGCRKCNCDLCTTCNQRHDELNKLAGTCKNGHKLKTFIPGRSGYGCDGCRKSIASNVQVYGCRKCNYDLCTNCNTKQGGTTKKKSNNSNADCMNGHELKKFVPGRYGFGCDGCGRSIHPNETLYGCRRCDYDLCENCHQIKKSWTSQKNEGKSKVRCDKGHSLIGVIGWICNQCRQGFLSETMTYHCSTCQYDLCPGCHARKKGVCLYVCALSSIYLSSKSTLIFIFPS